jgi:hypothetical protein
MVTIELVIEVKDGKLFGHMARGDGVKIKRLDTSNVRPEKP